MSKNTYSEGQYIAGESLELGDYMLTADPEFFGSVEMFEDYDHFVSDDNFLFETFWGEYRVVLRKQGVVVVICDATFRRCE